MDTKTIDLKKYLEQRLLEPLPGNKAHLIMSPSVNGIPFRSFKPNSNAKQNAVLVLLSGNDINTKIILTLRSSKLKNHSNQISFPGGRIESNETKIQAALRETNEEIGLDKSAISIIGELSPLYVPPSDSIIYPIVGYIHKLPTNFMLNPEEVEEAFLTPITHLFNHSKKLVETWNFNGTDVDVPLWTIHSHTPLWGATAMILSELIVILEPYFNHRT